MSTLNIRENCAVLGGGDVEYSLEKAAVPIDALIKTLEDAKSEGATHVVQSSGNWRGARWMRTSLMYDWAEDYDVD